MNKWENKLVRAIEASRLADVGVELGSGATREAWQMFRRIERLNAWEARRYIRDMRYEGRMTLEYALSRNHAVDWLAIRASLSRRFPSSAARAFRNTHGY